MISRLHFLALLSLALLPIAASAETARSFLCCDYGGNQVCIVSKSGEIEWRVEAQRPQDCWLLPNGNILFCYVAGAKEVTRDKQVVWEYKAPTDIKMECHACQPLPNGNVLVIETGTSRIIEVDRAGKIAKEIKLVTTCDKMHNQFRGTRKTAEGHYLVTFKGEGKVVELDGDGKVLREVQVAGDPHEIVRVTNGNWLITCGDGHKVVEVDTAGKTVWELNENDLPGNTLRLMAGCQRLPNGNTVICNYLGHGHLGEQPQVFEVTPDKKVVWQSADHAKFKDINQIQVLDVPGDVTKGEILR
ncbi:MAG: PQQ-binding-like beta-propeller repeat protein [Prosthecobacter sp.]|nr:PQQ-binding-like beta-propeller repeat protein [Prosthecobacter sp.]